MQAAQDAPSDAQAEGTEPRNGNNGESREKRSRDRYGRDRGPRGDRPQRHEFTENGVSELPPAGAAPYAAPIAAEVDPSHDAMRSDAAAAANELETAPVQAPEQAPVVAPMAAPAPGSQRAASSVPVAPSAVVAPAPVLGSMPKVSSYALPHDDLVQVAQGSGLQWVNTNADSVAKVQAAIAAEVQAVHVPRERPPVVSQDSGPLVLVETKRDLRNMTLPFEEGSTS
jgi:ribonuclease E